jgi:hypothetical protein
LLRAEPRTVFTGAYVSGTPAGVAALTVDMRDLGTREQGCAELIRI